MPKLTEEQIDAIIAAEDAKWEARATFEEAHELTKSTVEEGDDYRATFGAALVETRRKRAERARFREWQAWNHYRWGIGPHPDSL